MKNIPEIRFKDFNNKWDSKRLGDTSNFYSGGTPTSSNKEYYIGEIPFIRSGEIHLNKTELYINENALKNSSAKLVKKGDLLYALYGATSGEADISRISGAINQAILAIIPFKDYSKHFILNYLNKNKNSYLGKYLQGGQGNLSGQIVKNYILNFPNIKEQSCIGNLFKNIDELIENQESLVYSLKSFKKSMLQKMFPSGGKNVPQIRFSGFSGDWEESKFGDFLEEFSDKTKIEDEFDVLSSTNEFITDRDRKISSKSNKGYKIIDIEDLVLSPQNLWLGNININRYKKGIVSPSYYTFKIKGVDSKFLEPQLRTKRMMENYKNASSQGASVVRRNLEIDEFYNINLLVPSLPEQEKIGNFFKNLDLRISNEENLLDSYKSMKKSLLQKMFI